MSERPSSPSKHLGLPPQSSALSFLHGLDGKKTGPSFSHTPRFVRDGTNNQDKQPNFLNGQDGQGLELGPKHFDVDTNTHTNFTVPLMHGEKHALDITERIEKNLWSTPAVRSKSPKLCTSRSFISNDTRYSHAKDSYSEPIGPGHYWIEGGLPNLGPYPKDLSSKSTSPMRNPDVLSSSFLTTARPDPFPAQHTPENWFMGTEMSISSNIAPWCEQTNKRVDVPSYRSAGRFSEAKKEVPHDAQYPAAEGMNMSGEHTRVADAVHLKRNTRLAATAFQSSQPRLAFLPRGRINDMRLSRKFEDDDSKWLGPGAYTPLTSTGGAKRKTYRLYNISQPPTGTDRLPAGRLGARSSMLSWTSSRNPPSKNHSLRHIPPAAGNSSSFLGTGRNHKSGPYTWSQDSTLTRSL